MRIQTLLAACLIPTIPIFAQPSDPPEFVRSMLDAKDWPEVKVQLPVLDKWIRDDPKKACDQLLPYAQRAHLTAITFLKRVAKDHHGNREVANQLIPYFLRYDIGGSEEFEAGEGLFAFTAADYTSKTKTIIHEALRASFNPDPKYILACGAAQMKEEIPFLKAIMRDRKDEMDVFSETKMLPIAWQAKLACARMGEREDIRECIEIVRANKDSAQRLTVRLADVGYIRQPESVAYLQEILFSDGRYPELDSDIISAPLASYAIDVLSACLEGFPVPRSVSRYYTDEDIAKARDWMLEHKDWKIIR
jgi:hypothetical protein